MKKMIAIKSEDFKTWGCANCGWVFQASGPPRGDTLEQMKQNFEVQRDAEFAKHGCSAQTGTSERGIRRGNGDRK